MKEELIFVLYVSLINGKLSRPKNEKSRNKDATKPQKVQSPISLSNSSHPFQNKPQLCQRRHASQSICFFALPFMFATYYLILSSSYTIFPLFFLSTYKHRSIVKIIFNKILIANLCKLLLDLASFFLFAYNS